MARSKFQGNDFPGTATPPRQPRKTGAADNHFVAEQMTMRVDTFLFRVTSVALRLFA